MRPAKTPAARRRGTTIVCGDVRATVFGMRVTKKSHLHKLLADVTKRTTPESSPAAASADPPLPPAHPPAAPLARDQRTSPLDVQLQPDAPGRASARTAALDPGTRAALLGLIKTTPAATRADIDAVLQELSLVPPAVLDQLARYGVKIVVCHDTITEHLTELAGVRPRGWPPGSTWDDVPGLHLPGRYEVVVAAEIKRDRTVLHELGHAFDYVTALKLRQSDAYTTARDADHARLGGYFAGHSPAADEETFAESFAQFLRGEATWPHLFAFWAGVLDPARS